MAKRRSGAAAGEAQHDPRLEARTAHFAELLDRLGGPSRSVAQGRAGMRDIWRWLLALPAPQQDRWTDDDLRAAGPLPTWFAGDRSGLRRDGPDGVRIADGLAAMVTAAILESQPDASWIVEQDEFLGRVPKLEVRNGPPVPIEHGIARLVSLRHQRSPFEPADPDDYVAAVLESGDPRPRSWGSQTAAEARAILELVERGHVERAQAFIDAVTRAGGPADELDGSIDSLVPGWSWLIAQPLPATPMLDREMRRHELPWWYPFTARHVAQQLGPELVWLATWAADYAALVVLRAVPAAGWTIGSSRGGHDFREPLLRTAGPELDVHDRVARMLVSAHEGKEHLAASGLRDAAVRWHWLTPPATEVEPEPEGPPFEVGFPAPRSLVGRLMGRFPGPIEITFTDAVAHRESRRVDRFVRALTGVQGVTGAVREDRELVLVRAPGVSERDLREAIHQCWADAREA